MPKKTWANIVFHLIRPSHFRPHSGAGARQEQGVGGKLLNLQNRNKIHTWQKAAVYSPIVSLTGPEQFLSNTKL
jgi:hypothetical protein